MGSVEMTRKSEVKVFTMGEVKLEPMKYFEYLGMILTSTDNGSPSVCKNLGEANMT